MLCKLLYHKWKGIFLILNFDFDCNLILSGRRAIQNNYFSNQIQEQHLGSTKEIRCQLVATGRLRNEGKEQNLSFLTRLVQKGALNQSEPTVFTQNHCFTT